MSEDKVSVKRSWLTLGVMITLCVVNLLLIRQNLDLRNQLASGGRTLELTTNVLKPGDLVPSVTATDLDGQLYKVDYARGGHRRLLLFFSPSCPYCQQQSPLWRALLDNVDASRFIVLGVVSDKEDRELVSAHARDAGYFKTKTSLPVVFFDDETLGTYKLTATPTTLLINEDGRVKHAWVGKWDERRATEVAAALR